MTPLTWQEALAFVIAIGLIYAVLIRNLAGWWQTAQDNKAADVQDRRARGAPPLTPREQTAQTLRVLAVGIVLLALLWAAGVWTSPFTPVYVLLPLALTFRAWTEPPRVHQTAASQTGQERTSRQMLTAPPAQALIRCGHSDPDPRVEAKAVAARARLQAPTGFDGCQRPMLLATAFRCVECGRYLHRACAVRHFASHRALSPKPAALFDRVGPADPPPAGWRSSDRWRRRLKTEASRLTQPDLKF